MAITDVKIFVKNWKDELRSQVQPIVKAGKRKPTITIIRVGDDCGNSMVELCKDIGFIGDLYNIPIDSGVTSKDLRDIVINAETDKVYVEEPLPDGFENPFSKRGYVKEGILIFLKSLNIDPQGSRVVLNFAADGYEVQIGETVLTKEDVTLLEQMAVLESGIEYWKDDVGESE